MRERSKVVVCAKQAAMTSHNSRHESSIKHRLALGIDDAGTTRPNHAFNRGRSLRTYKLS